MRSVTLCLLTYLASSSLLHAQGQRPVEYDISFPNAAHHEARVSVVFPAISRPGPLRIEFARASPGRYALHEFSKNVYAVAAEDAQGRPLPLRHPDPYSWEVVGPRPPHCRFRYTVFADRADGTYAAIDAERAHLNLPAVLAYSREYADFAQQVRVALLDTGWDVSTQLQKIGSNYPLHVTYQAPNLQYLMDSPMLVGRLRRRVWTQSGQTIEIGLLHRGSPIEGDSLAARTQRITRAAEAVWGTLPKFDYGSYTFLADYLPTAVGDGMEHRNSTMVPQPKPLKGGDTDHLGTISHEFFHSWNVERLRPADLEPFDFQRANMSSLLWLAEGFTQYYGDLIMRRAGLLSDDAYFREAAQLINQSRLPGAGRFSPIEMSQQAPFVDAARSIDPTNRLNTYVSYYTIGGATALALDLQLRARNHSLDEVMRRLWATNGQFQTPDFAPQKPYSLPDVQRAIADVTADSAFAGQFVRRHISGHQPHDWAALLAPMGLTLAPADPAKLWLGAPGLEFGPTGATLTGGTRQDGPLHAAGLDRNDRIESFNGRKIRSEKDWTKALKNRKPSDVVTLQVSQRGLPTRPVSVTLAADPAVKLAPLATATDAQKALRRLWLVGR